MIEALTSRESQKPYISALRAAKDYRQRPTSMILHDPYALHRHWWDSDWKPSLGDDAWTDWDYTLADVFQVIEDYTDGESGQFIPFDASGDVWWDVKSKFSGSMAALDRERSTRGELNPGETLYAVPTFKNPDAKPTLESWARDLEEEKADLRPGALRDARPPTGDELRRLRESTPVE